MNGGYFMIDCTGLDLIKGSTPQEISGIYNLAKTALESNKPVFAVNCNWGGKFVSPIQVFGIDFTSNLIFTASTLQIVITTSNIVTINNMAE